MTTIQERLRDAAVERANDESRRRLRASDTLRLGTSERMGDLIELVVIGGEPECFVAEVIARRGQDRTEETLYAIAVGGVRVPERFTSIDHALLAVVAYRHNGANMNDRGWEFAARALGVPAGSDA